MVEMARRIMPQGPAPSSWHESDGLCDGSGPLCDPERSRGINAGESKAPNAVEGDFAWALGHAAKETRPLRDESFAPDIALLSSPVMGPADPWISEPPSPQAW